MAGTVSFAGISSSQNFNTIIDALVDARKQRRIAPLETFKTQWSTKLDSISKIDTALSSFYSTLRAADRLNEFLVRTASSSDDSVLTVSASSSAVPGSHTVTVGTNIKHRLGSDGKTDKDATIYATAGSSLQITVGTTTETIIVTENSTLAQVAAVITSQSTQVSAEIIDDGSTSNPYRLVLTSKTGGAAGRITTTGNTTNVNFGMTSAQRVDSTELGAGWGGTGTVIAGGQYLGTTNKTFRFSIAGTGDKTIGTDAFDVTWTDGEGNSGTIGVTDSSYINLSVYQGVTLSLDALGQTVKGGDTFSIDVWHNDLQAGQNAGIAQSEKETHSGFADANTTAVTTASATFAYTYNGRSTTIDVGAGTTLTGLMNLINSDPSNPGVTASLINDGTGLSTAYHLVLSGKSSGAAYQITSISHTLDNFTGTFSESKSAQNAMFQLDGYPAGNVYVQRSNNHVTDGISGLTFDMKEPGTAVVTVVTDTSAMLEKVKQFQEAFNNLKAAIKNETYYDKANKTSGSLLGNYAVQIIQQKLNGLFTAHAPGFKDPEDIYVNLQQLGFGTDVTEGSSTEGQLILDEDILRTALGRDPDAVADVFASYLQGASDSATVLFNSAIPATDANIYEIQADTNPLSPNYQKGRFRVKGETSWHDWVPMTGSSGNYSLTGNSGPEAGLALRISYGDGHSPTGETPDAIVRVKNGILTALALEMENILSTSGPLETLTDNYNEILTNVEKRIDAEERRLEIYKSLLQQRFARLDAYINQMNGFGDFLTAFASSVSTGGGSSTTGS